MYHRLNTVGGDHCGHHHGDDYLNTNLCKSHLHKVQIRQMATTSHVKNFKPCAGDFCIDLYLNDHCQLCKLHTNKVSSKCPGLVSSRDNLKLNCKEKYKLNTAEVGWLCSIYNLYIHTCISS